MGGHEGGEFASATLVEKLDEVELAREFDAAREQVAEAIRKANRAILVEANKRKKQMGSTIVALLVQGERYAILWVGDSRAYLPARRRIRSSSPATIPRSRRWSTAAS